MNATEREALRDIFLHVAEARRILDRAGLIVGELPPEIAAEVFVQLQITAGALDGTPEAIEEIVGRGGGPVPHLPEPPPSWGDQLIN